MNIVIIGIRGYSVIYSGFETFVNKLVNKSNKKIFSYLLFVRSSYKFNDKIPPKNVSLLKVPTIKGKYLDPFFYTLISNLLSIKQNVDIVLYLGLPSTLGIIVQKILKRKIIVNVDGLDWRRKRWNFFGKTYLKFCELLTVIFSDVIITDSKEIFSYYRNKYKLKNTLFIPYGAKVIVRKPGKTLAEFGLTVKRYIHTVGRFTPENSIEDLILAFKKIKTSFNCVIIGDSVYEDKYKKQLLDLAKNDQRIIFTGFLKGRDYEEICSNSYLYIETKTQGGIHPSLLEAMAFGNCVVANKIHSHIEVLKNNGLYYNNKNELTSIIRMILKRRLLKNKIGESNKDNIKANYKWQKVIRQYENLFLNIK